MPRSRRTMRVVVTVVAWWALTLVAATAAGAAPAPPTITAAPSSPGASTTPAWSFTTRNAATTVCELSRDTAVVAPRGECASPATYDLGGEPDGTYTFSVWGVDGSGRESRPATSSYVLDRAGPPAPVITSAPASPSDGRSPAWAFSTAAGTSTVCALSRGNKAVSGPAPCASPAGYDLAGQPDGTYTFSVHAVDPSARESEPATSTYELSSPPPAAPTITSGPPSPGTSRTPAWSFTATSGATTTCQLARGSRVVAPFAPCSSPKSYDLADQPDGTYTFSVRVPSTNASGKAGSTATSSYVLDTAGGSTGGPAGSGEPAPETPGADAPATGDQSGAAGAGGGGEPSTPGTASPLVGRAGAGDTPGPGAGGAGDGTDGAGDEGGGSGGYGGDYGGGEGAGDDSAASVPASTGAGNHDAVDDDTNAVVRLGAAALKTTSFPMLLVVVVLAFLAVQDRMDRRDPKLALAPVYGERELSFDDPPSPIFAMAGVPAGVAAGVPAGLSLEDRPGGGWA